MKDRKKPKNAMLVDDSSSSPATTAPRDVPQAGAICYRCNRNGRLSILLVGSRRNGRWGVPKGHIDPGETSDRAASRESFEEAGVVGEVDIETFGSFTCSKDSSAHRYHVTVHLLRVTEVSTDFPEKSVRKQKWFPLKAAVRGAAQPGLRSLLAKLETMAL